MLSQLPNSQYIADAAILCQRSGNHSYPFLPPSPLTVIVDAAESSWMTSGTTSGSSEQRGKGRESMHNMTTSVWLGRNKTEKQRDIMQ